MPILNLYNSDISDVKFKLNRFPDGEVQVTDLEMDKLEKNMKVIAPIRNAEELFIFVQVMYLIHDMVDRVNIIIPYMMGARNDRIMNEGRSVNLFNVLWVISNSLFPLDTLKFITVHNESAVSTWFDYDCFDIEDCQIVEFVMPYPHFYTNEKEMVVFPDTGAEKRFSHLVSGPYLVAKKTRDINQSQSQILSYELLNPENHKLDSIEKVIVIDDLIDGGATFKLLSEQLSKLLPQRIEKDLYATHFIQEDRLISLTEYYNNIYVCDTFRPIPEHKNIHKMKNLEEMY